MTQNLKEQKAITLQKRLMVALYFLVFGILMAVGTGRDLEIDKALFHYQNGFAVFMERYGMLPKYILVFLCCSVLAASFPTFGKLKENALTRLPKCQKFFASRGGTAVLVIVYAALLGAVMYYGFLGSDEFLGFLLGTSFGGNLQDIIWNAGAPKWVAVLVWSFARAALLALAVALFHKISREKRRVLVFMAIAGLLMYEGGNLIAVLKVHFHRIRFREMIAYSHGLIGANGYSYRGGNDLPREWIDSTQFFAYTPWYQVGNDYGIYSEPTSFPSGHTAAAAYSLLLPALVSKYKNAAKWFTPAFLLSFGYTLTMGITRLVRGAHYMTDIAAGAIIMLAVLLVVMGVMNAVERKVQKKAKRAAREKERHRLREKASTEELPL